MIFKLLESNILQKPIDTELSPSAVSVFPNPSFGDFTIDAGELTIQQIEVYDLAGRLVQKLHNKATITPLNKQALIF